MIVPIIFPSAGDLWRFQPQLLDYKFNLPRRLNLPEDYSIISSKAAGEVANILGLSTPLYIAAPHPNLKRHTKKCVILAQQTPFPQMSFVPINRGGYDIYVACPELCFLQAARTLDFVDLVRFGYDLCALYYPNPNSQFGQMDRTSITFTSYIRKYLKANQSFYGAARALKALRYVNDFSNSPMESKLAMFTGLPENVGGCDMRHIEMNPTITLTAEGKALTGLSELRCDLRYNKLVAVEYNSNAVHLDSKEYTTDMNRLAALNLAGYPCIVITAGDVQKLHLLENKVNAIRATLGMPPLERNPKRKELFNRLFKE